MWCPVTISRLTGSPSAMAVSRQNKINFSSSLRKKFEEKKKTTQSVSLVAGAFVYPFPSCAYISRNRNSGLFIIERERERDDTFDSDS